jgi:2-dehydro-3-deoxyphosphogluconate aldolase/(4S)-4-hydroxy-2-oxoglutarate aldolase
MLLLEHGFSLQKFFPAEVSGGVAYLKSLASVLSAARFCPTGGIDQRNAESYLALPNVICVGGSWIAPAALVNSANWEEITRLAASAASIHRRR